MLKKGRTARRPATRRKAPKGQPLWKSFIRFIARPPVARLLLAIIVAAIIYWFWPAITRWAISIWESLFELLGLGIAFVLVAFIAIIWIICQGRFSLLARYWNWWLGGTCLVLAVWGLLAFFAPGSGLAGRATLGGTVGRNIITAPDAVGALKISGLTALSILFMAPRWSWHLVTGTVKGIGRFLRGNGKATPRVSPSPRTALKPEPEQPRSAKIELAPAEPRADVPESAPPAPAQKDAWEAGKYKPVLTAGGWQLPPINILDKPAEVELSQIDIEKRGQLIEEALASYGVDARVSQINPGPTVTQFGVEPGWDRKYKEIKERDKDGNVSVRLQEISKTRVKVERINSLASDLALALAAPSIRIEAPIPGKSMVGVEVPNTTFGTVNLRSVIESSAFQKLIAKSKLALALGKGAGGEAVVADLPRMPHLLIAGATGSGKTACLNSVICCLLLNDTPDDTQFIMIDPKRVELVNFNALPHLLAPVVVDTGKAVSALRWLNQEMDNRYHKFAEAGARNIDSYNKNRRQGETLPYIVVVIDELADLMMAAFDEVERTLCRLAQLARATGIHLIVATQRPSVDVITGLIKANFPTRISFALTSQVDSRTILDSAGAEKLLGRGDMLYMPTDAAKPKRLQGTFVSDAEIERLVSFWSKQRRPEVTLVKFDDASQAASGEKTIEDSMLDAARQLAHEHKEVSTSFLQRRLRIGYPRAARLMEALEKEGFKRTGAEQRPEGIESQPPEPGGNQSRLP